MSNADMALLVGGPKPCGCGGVGHKGHCSWASDEEKAAYRAWLDKFLKEQFHVKH